MSFQHQCPLCIKDRTLSQLAIVLHRIWHSHSAHEDTVLHANRGHLLPLVTVLVHILETFYL